MCSKTMVVNHKLIVINLTKENLYCNKPWLILVRKNMTHDIAITCTVLGFFFKGIVMSYCHSHIVVKMLLQMAAFVALSACCFYVFVSLSCL